MDIIFVYMTALYFVKISVLYFRIWLKIARKLPNFLNKYGLLSVAQCYSHLGLTKNFESLHTEKDYILKILRDIDTSKAAGFDRPPGRFLKDGANVLARPVTDICNLLISLNKFPSAFKLAKVNLFSKKDERLMFQIIDLFPYCQYFRRSLKKLFTNKQLNF